MKIVIIGAMERELAPMIAGVQDGTCCIGHKVRLYELKAARGIRRDWSDCSTNAAEAALTHLSSRLYPNDLD